MNCPNCAAAIPVHPNDQTAWCQRCGTTGELMTGGHWRRIRIPILTQQMPPAELRAIPNPTHPEGACL